MAVDVIGVAAVDLTGLHTDILHITLFIQHSFLAYFSSRLSFLSLKIKLGFV